MQARQDKEGKLKVPYAELPTDPQGVNKEACPRLGREDFAFVTRRNKLRRRKHSQGQSWGSALL